MPEAGAHVRPYVDKLRRQQHAATLSSGWTTVRISIDAKAFAPHLSDVDARITAPILAMSTATFNRGIARAEIAESVSPRTAAENMFGSVLMHVIALEPEGYPDRVHTPASTSCRSCTFC